MPAVPSIAAHRVKRIRDREDAGRQWNIFAGQMVRVAAAVLSVMTVQHEGKHVANPANSDENLGAEFTDRLKLKGVGMGRLA